MASLSKSKVNATSRKKVVRESKGSSFEFMLAEFNRIQSGETYNRSSGDTRINLYLSIFSLTGASLGALWQLVDTRSPASLQEFFFLAFTALSLLSLIGLVTLRLIVQRWHLAVIYLRKLSRIRRWFVDRDPSLYSGLVYSIDDTKPLFLSKEFLSSSLLTLVSLFNSVSLTFALAFLSLLLFPSLLQYSFGAELMVSVGSLVGLTVWWSQHRYVRGLLVGFEKDRLAAFPIFDQEK